jgi:two-component system nitrate/nitrite response regulator NarL
MKQPAQAAQGAIRVLIADNTSIHSQLLADAMKRDHRIHVLAAVSSYREFLELASRLPLDLGLIGSSLDEQPGRGFELLRALRALRPNVPAIMLLESSRREMVLEAFRAGAKGIFSKDGHSGALCKCVRRVHEGQVWANGRELHVALDALAAAPVRAFDPKGIALLSQRELDIVQLLAQGLTNLEIGERISLSKHTVKNYLVRIFDKLGVANRLELLTMILGHPAVVQDRFAEVGASEEKATHSSSPPGPENENASRAPDSPKGQAPEAPIRLPELTIAVQTSDAGRKSSVPPQKPAKLRSVPSRMAAARSKIRVG